MERTVQRTEVIRARCRPRERRVIAAGAQAAGVTMSELIRDATIQAARRALRRVGEEPEVGAGNGTGT